VGCDWDGDGDMDILCGNTAGYIEFFENLSGPGVAQPKWAAPRRLEAGGETFRVQAGPNGSIQGPAEAKWGYTTLSVADWDGDGLPDIVANSIWGGPVAEERRHAERAAIGGAAADRGRVGRAAPKPAWTWWQPRGRSCSRSGGPRRWHDWNGDGLTDLAMLDTKGTSRCSSGPADGRLVLLPPAARLLRRRGEPLRLNARTAGASGRRKLCVVDWDGDGVLDFLVNSANADFYRGLGMPSRRQMAVPAGRGRWPSGTSKGTTSAPQPSISMATASPTSSAARKTAGSTSSAIRGVAREGHIGGSAPHRGGADRMPL
jgi:hypothetical protein